MTHRYLRCTLCALLCACLVSPLLALAYDPNNDLPASDADLRADRALLEAQDRGNRPTTEAGKNQRCADIRRNRAEARRRSEDMPRRASREREAAAAKYWEEREFYECYGTVNGNR